jgi:hypothetical protein
MKNRSFACGAGMAIAALLAPTSAEASEFRNRQGSVTLVAAKWAEFNLPQFPVRLITADLNFRSPYLIAVGVNRVVVHDFSILGLKGNSVELEGQLAKHFGGQDHVEATLGATLRTGELRLIGTSSVNLGWTNGLSYAFEKPAYEMGTSGIRGVDTRQLQYYLGIETEFTPSSTSPVNLILKIHHRSGIYGLISPQRTGSNYLGGGIRFGF